MARRRRVEPAVGVHPRQALVLYQGVQHEADRAVHEAAVADLAGELVLLGGLLRRQIEQDSDNFELTIKAMHLLGRRVTAQHKLTGGEAAALEAQLEAGRRELALVQTDAFQALQAIPHGLQCRAQMQEVPHALDFCP